MTPSPFPFTSTVSLLNLAFIENGYLKRPNVDNKTVLHIQLLEPVSGHCGAQSIRSQPHRKLSKLTEGHRNRVLQIMNLNLYH